jgi:D-alanyl-D-alanine carboxypeptidase/D-alanyl-D-alanine-endopeptidase (penicillin-binding protein 4)
MTISFFFITMILSFMKTSTRSIIFLAGLFALAQAAGSGQQTKKSKRPVPKTCAVQIESLLKDTLFKHSFVGIKIVSLKTGKLIYEQNSTKLFRPASNVKLFTSAAGLSLLGKEFRFRTEVTADTEIAGGVLQGSLYVKGYGDPMLSFNDVASLAGGLYEAGLREIRGDIVGDVSYFDDHFWGKGWMWDDDPGGMWPFFSSLSLNGNAVAVKVSPGFKAGDSVGVLLEPPTSYVTLRNGGTTVLEPAIAPLNVTRLWKERQNTITVEGTIQPGADTQTTRLNVWRPELFTLTVFKERLEAGGIIVQGSVRIGDNRPSVHMGSVAHSLDSVVILINKDSYNLAAENLLKTLAAELKQEPGVSDSGAVVVKDFLHSMGIDTSQVVLADGSGVSRYNLASPEAFVKLLMALHKKPEVFGTFWKSLAVAGVDGTLKSRMVKSPATGKVYAKTGVHSDVSALSGYVLTSANDTLAFSILMNHFTGNIEPYRKTQDRIMEILTTCK